MLKRHAHPALVALLLFACTKSGSAALPDDSLTVQLFTQSGAGTVTSDPPGIDCPGTCTYPFPPNTTVVLTAVPVTSSAFQGWDLCSLSSGDCDGGNGGCTGATCSVTLSGDVTLEANFAAAPAQVDYLAVTLVSADGVGKGSVTSSPAGIDCSLDASCTAQTGAFPVSSPSVTIVATPDAGSSFAGWSSLDDTTDCGAGSTCVVTLEPSTVSATATFQASP